MAKTDINRLTGKVKPPVERFRRYLLQESFNRMDSEANQKRKRTNILGPKTIAINAYIDGERRDKAYVVIQSRYVKSNGEPVYSKEIIDQWIDEYEQNQKKVRDDDDAR